MRAYFCDQVTRVSLPGGEEKDFEITPMADAAVRGHLEIIEIIVEYGGQINAINEVSSLSHSLSLSLSLPHSVCYSISYLFSVPFLQSLELFLLVKLMWLSSSPNRMIWTAHWRG